MHSNINSKIVITFFDVKFICGSTYMVKDVAKISTNKLSTFGFDFTFIVISTYTQIYTVNKLQDCVK
jgi:hypothetical protein